MDSAAEAFTWLLNDFVASTEGATNAIAVSADGISLASSDSMPLESADTFAAITAGLSSLVRGAADCFGEPTVERLLVEMGGSFLMVTTISHGSVLGVTCEKTADLSLVAYEMTMFAKRAGSVLSPTLIAELQNSLAA